MGDRGATVFRKVADNPGGGYKPRQRLFNINNLINRRQACPSVQAELKATAGVSKNYYKLKRTPKSSPGFFGRLGRGYYAPQKYFNTGLYLQPAR